MEITRRSSLRCAVCISESRPYQSQRDECNLAYCPILQNKTIKNKHYVISILIESGLLRTESNLVKQDQRYKNALFSQNVAAEIKLEGTTKSVLNEQSNNFISKLFFKTNKDTFYLSR